MEGEQGELSTRMPISFETIVACMKLLGVGGKTAR